MPAVPNWRGYVPPIWRGFIPNTPSATPSSPSSPAPSSPSSGAMPTSSPSTPTGIGFWNTLARDIFGGLGSLGSGLGGLVNFGGNQTPPVSAGGWAIDRNGNLIPPTSATPAGAQNVSQLANPFGQQVSAGGTNELGMGLLSRIKGRTPL